MNVLRVQGVSTKDRKPQQNFWWCRIFRGVSQLMLEEHAFFALGPRQYFRPSDRVEERA